MTAYPNWLSALRAYLVAVAVGDFAWEAAHLPLYTLWRTGTGREKLFAVVHCAEMRQQMRQGAEMSLDMQRMATYCQHMDHTMGAQRGRSGPY
ncbi:hypothetical protein [Belnapia rosea]|uniref:hypothetical protein n=1 Tax=Belnapia rosea TaxID=938405 RepID=UPI0008915688|nr:hypothetical protein [Belnapia rosea]SDB71729.1 hypothetical protein SAMN02927895_04198 [Belnapia rosea]